MEKKIKRKLEDYKNFTYSQLVKEALQLKGNLKRKQDFDLLKEANQRAGVLFENRDPFFQREITKSVSKLLGIPYFDIFKEGVDKETARFLPQFITENEEVLTVLKKGNKLIIAVSNPLAINTISNLPQINGYSTQFVLSDRSDINKYISELFSATDNIDNKKIVESTKMESFAQNKISQQSDKINEVITIKDSSPVSLIETIFKEAVSVNATDMHFEPLAENMRVRFRVDGMLLEKFRIPEHLVTSTISRVKVLSNLDITEVRFPQDGRMSVNIDQKEYHLRVATMPTKMGETIVFRVIQESNIFSGLEHLGLGTDDCIKFKSIIFKPHGMVLVTGPIGSGKSTSLYAALNEQDTARNKVVTIEDPVECLLPGISQVEVDSKLDINFVNSLRSVLRQDADILMIGEIRDIETAKIAVRAALTGQLLFSTLHSVDTISAITTLRNFDVPPFLIASALNGIVAQRLVRKICNSCKINYSPVPKLLQQLGVKESDWGVEFAYGPGCNECSGIGYSGRTAIFEIFEISDVIKDAIINDVKESELRKLSSKEGLKTLHEAGVEKVIQKITTPEEVMREIFLKGGKL